ncbi:hypothetical protein CDAR_43621 [Caerostris darwini]|uniref:Uncharacterized protein n=1 Tax=Caerostris darwini TaxID=1538125 RepID=A0AAV4WIY1_9ARAC|nr:hypothetical protein CDAR_43621 [Caerostris darwini]
MTNRKNKQEMPSMKKDAGQDPLLKKQICPTCNSDSSGLKSPKQSDTNTPVSPNSPDSHVDGSPVAIVTDASPKVAEEREGKMGWWRIVLIPKNDYIDLSSFSDGIFYFHAISPAFEINDNSEERREPSPTNGRLRKVQPNEEGGRQ